MSFNDRLLVLCAVVVAITHAERSQMPLAADKEFQGAAATAQDAQPDPSFNQRQDKKLNILLRVTTTSDTVQHNTDQNDWTGEKGSDSTVENKKTKNGDEGDRTLRYLGVDEEKKLQKLRNTEEHKTENMLAWLLTNALAAMNENAEKKQTRKPKPFDGGAKSDQLISIKTKILGIQQRLVKRRQKRHNNDVETEEDIISLELEEDDDDDEGGDEMSFEVGFKHDSKEDKKRKHSNVKKQKSDKDKKKRKTIRIMQKDARADKDKMKEEEDEEVDTVFYIPMNAPSGPSPSSSVPKAGAAASGGWPQSQANNTGDGSAEAESDQAKGGGAPERGVAGGKVPGQPRVPISSVVPGAAVG